MNVKTSSLVQKDLCGLLLWLVLLKGRRERSVDPRPPIFVTSINCLWAIESGSGLDFDVALFHEGQTKRRLSGVPSLYFG